MAFSPAREVIQCCGLHGKLSSNAPSASSIAPSCKRAGWSSSHFAISRTVCEEVCACWELQMAESSPEGLHLYVVQFPGCNLNPKSFLTVILGFETTSRSCAIRRGDNEHEPEELVGTVVGRHHRSDSDIGLLAQQTGTQQVHV